MTEELKPCPFCGGKPYFENEGSDYGFYAVCSRCGCWTGALRTKDESLKRWNNRPIEDLKDDENAWLEKNLKDYNRVMLENARLREVLQMIAVEKDNHGKWLSVEQVAQIAKDALEGCLI